MQSNHVVIKKLFFKIIIKVTFVEIVEKVKK